MAADTAAAGAAAGAGGYWGDVTASVNWCEDDYVWTSYVAEWWNCISSIPIAFVGFYGLVHAYRLGYEKRFQLAFALVALIGIGSMAFHGTLLYAGQALDELPMIYGSTMFFWTALEHESPSHRNKLLPYILVVYSIMFSVVYVFAPAYFVVFLLTYIVTIIFLAYKSWKIMKQSSDRTARTLFWTAFGVYVGGFLLLWIPENLWCHHLKPLQFHAWFHLTSSVGPYVWVLFAMFQRMKTLKRTPVLARGGGLLPFVHLV